MAEKNMAGKVMSEKTMEIKLIPNRTITLDNRLTLSKRMKTIAKKALLPLVMSLFLFGITASAQEVDDAVALAMPNGSPSARVLALGSSYLGIIDDISASIYNPAGLVLLPKSEFTMGFNFRNNKVTTTQFNTSTSTNNNKFLFNNIGIAMPIPKFYKGSRRSAFSLLYNRESDLNREHRTDWYNPNSTLASYYAKVAPELLYYIYLSPKWDKSKTPITKDLQQTSTVLQSGSIHNFTVAYARELTTSFSIGGSLQIRWGTQNFTRDYDEYDINGKYVINDTVNYTSLDFQRLRVFENIEKSIAGVTGNIGFLWKIGDFTRINANIKLPSINSVIFSDTLDAYASFKNGDNTKSYTKSHYRVAYSLYTPAVFSFGASFNAMGATLTTGVEYSDLSSMSIDQFSNTGFYSDVSQSFVAAQNRLFRAELTGLLSWGVGAEYRIPSMPITVRASYNSKSSPYSSDVEGSNRKIFGLGAGIDLDQGFRIDVAAQFTSYKEYLALYGNDIDSRYILNNSPYNFGINLSYRF